MIPKALDKDEIIKRQKKIIDALMNRVERGNDIETSHFGIFQSAIMLQSEVIAKSQRLEDALNKLGNTFDELQNIQDKHKKTENNLTDALGALDEGFALFKNKKLVIYNDHFRYLVREISPIISPSLKFSDYIQALIGSKSVLFESQDIEYQKWLTLEERLRTQPYLSLVLPLKNQHYSQLSFRRTSTQNIAILQTDITAIYRQSLKEKDALIDQHTRYLQGSFDRLPIAVASFSAQWRLQLSNTMFQEMLNLPPILTAKETSVFKILHFLNEFVLEESSQIPISDLDQDTISGLLSNPYRVVTNTGQILTAELFEHPESGYMFSVRDITAEDQAKTALRLMNVELEKRVSVRTRELDYANKKLRKAKEFAEKANMSKTRFLAAASHDLLQPVNAAKLYISMLHEASLEGQEADYVTRLDRAFCNMENLLHDLLDISHLESNTTKFNKTSIRLCDFLDNIREYMGEIAREKNIELRVRCQDLFIMSDPHYLGRVIQNLVVNAIQYTAENGKVLIAGRPRGNHVNIEVWDTGAGIEKENLKKIFQEFTRLDPQQSHRTGMGLGLSIVEQSCRQLEHEIEVKSNIGKGSLFRVSVPLADFSPIENFKPIQEVNNTSFDCLILLIENDQEVLYATSCLLESWGASVLAVPSIQEALLQYHELGEAPHLIISDYALDHGTGIDAIKAIRHEVSEALPAIIITANQSEALERSAMLHNFSVLKKPIHLASLRKLISVKTNRLKIIQEIA